MRTAIHFKINIRKFANIRNAYYFCIMQIEFDQEYLRELYQLGQYSVKFYATSAANSNI